MAITHTNRRGDVYQLQRGTTKTGKDRYWFGRKLTGLPVDEVPEGFEIYEEPGDALVYLRRRVESPILATELELVRAAARRQLGEENAIVQIEGKKGREMVVYVNPIDAEDRLAALRAVFPGAAVDEAMGDFIRQNRRYDKMMRFTLADEGKRLFSVDRWCFKGSIDKWWHLEGDFPLNKLVAKYVKHLGQDSFFDLM